MAHEYGNIDIYNGLAGNEPFTMFIFIDIMVDNPIYLTTYPDNILLSSALGVNSLYYNEWIEATAPPSRTGNVTQEIQRFTIAQGMGANYDDAPLDFIRLLGDDFHNSMIYVRALMQPEGKDLIIDSPISQTEGLMKGVTRSVNKNNVTVEFSNSYGKLAQVNELRTTSGSIKRRNGQDTSFDRAYLETTKHLMDWGIRPGGKKK